MRHGLDRGVSIGIVLLATMIVGIAATSYLNTRKLRDDNARASQSRNVIDAVATIRADVRKLQAGQRAYIISGVEDWLAPYHEASSALKAESSTLKSLTADDSDQRSRAETVSREIESGIHSLNQVIALRRKDGYEAVLAFSLKRGSRSFVDPLLETLTEMDRDERTRLAAWEFQAQEAYARSVLYGLAAAVLGLVAVGLFVAVLRRSILRRIRDASRLEAQRELLSTTLSSIGDAVIATDAAGRVTFLNPVAQKLTGWAQGDAVGHPLTEIFPIINETTRLPVENPAFRALKEGVVVGLANHTLLIARDGTERPIDDSAAPMRDGAGVIIGTVLVFRDVTERKQAEEALRGSEARYRAIVEATPECVKLVSPNGTLLQMNPAGLGMVEADHADSVLGQCIYHVLSPTSRGEYQAFNERVCRGEGGRLEFDIIGLKGTLRHMETTAVPLPTPGGGFNHLAVTRDVTDRRQAEADKQRLLREVEAEREQLAQVFQMAPSFMCVLRGPDHVYERANERYFELVGRRDFIGRRPREAFPEVARQGFFEILDTVYKTGEPFVGKDMPIVICRGGTMEERYREFVYQPLRDGNGAVSGILVNGIDLTDRKRVEAERARDAILLANVHDAVVVTNLDGIVTYWNDGATRLFGWTVEEMLGRPYADRFPEPVRSWVAAEIRSRAEGSEWTGEYEDYRKDGSRVWIDARVTRVSDTDGRMVGILGLSHDITERKRAEAALKEMDRRKDDFIALLAHELRNPLAPIRNGLQVMQLSDDPANRERVQAMMSRQLSHMVRLVDDLLDVSRIGRNKMELRRATISLAEMVESAVETARPVIDEAGHELTVSLPSREILLNADLTRLAQVFSNLLTNSAKYTERGGRIELSAEQRDGIVVVTVRDTGIGIPAEALPTIFDMFSQVDRPIERSGGGLGIGLALVKGLVEMHGGTVTAWSDGQGMGSSFTVNLPILAEPPELMPTTLSDGDRGAAGMGHRILVVDDNPDGAESLALMLELLGNEVQTANDGLAAVDLAEAFRPEVILMDVGMPKLDGLEATRRIREEPWGKTITIFALTGWGQEGDKERSREAGCDGHLVKPVARRDLETLLGEFGRKPE